jgi:hypothetical protein
MLKGDKCIGKCTLEKRNAPPGPQLSRRRRISDRGLQLREKQKARQSYGVLERQFRKIFAKAASRPGATGENLIQLRERLVAAPIYLPVRLNLVMLSPGGRGAPKPPTIRDWRNSSLPDQFQVGSAGMRTAPRDGF